MQKPNQHPEQRTRIWEQPYTQELLLLWAEIFGLKVRSAIEYPNDIFKVVVDRTQAILNRFNEREGEVCLFLRNPVTDRLILERSTVSCLNPGTVPPPTQLFENMKNNYDPASQTAFYDLYDRLSSQSEKRSEYSRKMRGLTGWVAVSGHPLLINDQNDLNDLISKLKIDIPLQSTCLVYGMPLWGNRVTEFLYEDPHKWIKHYLAVPIKSIINPNCTIGVLRYACSLESQELNEMDQWALSWLAQIISNIKNLEYEKTVHDRNKTLPHRIAHLRENGDLHSFLEFLATSLRSKIASAYISVTEEDKTKLRLIEAFGISGKISDLRKKGEIEDYSHERSGLTWQLYESFQNRVKVYSSVGDDKAWTGRNTDIFYKHALAKLGFEFISEQLRNQSERGPLVRSYSIKLMGMGLSEKNVPVGVLKVEFPSDYDSSFHYKDEDRQFFQDCAEEIKLELVKYKDMINGKWFKKSNDQSVCEFVRIAGYIFQNKLIDKNHHMEFWTNAEKFAKTHYETIKKLDDQILQEINLREREWLFEIKNVGKKILGIVRRWWVWL
ncbi:MAG: hypothetical protein NPIRA05_00920 [Nitrospirales bacterium]|nr:MAG: hypothetical protein NPIRA05_00920 [Nitrospirales bacterium]